MIIQISQIRRCGASEDEFEKMELLGPHSKAIHKGHPVKSEVSEKKMHAWFVNRRQYGV